MAKRKYIRNINRLRHTQGCLTDCVAYVLNKHPWHVPFFIYPRVGWNERLQSYFRKQGYRAYWKNCVVPPKTGTHILLCNSSRWKTATHAAVFRNGELVYDPAFPSTFNTKGVTHKLVLKENEDRDRR